MVPREDKGMRGKDGKKKRRKGDGRQSKRWESKAYLERSGTQHGLPLECTHFVREEEMNRLIEG
ncbi:hypothetical protein E2C01_029653 [Portunus trituberculatus]|uniref:Uncharacterized protein n=1 Tax=Portunus trituberculatus TaxID=210409 RepID=A0A5B7EV52_PORTR|nr:hypothetical protein [Portunus trituberculatus]